MSGDCNSNAVQSWNFAYDGDGVRVLTSMNLYDENGAALTPTVTKYYFGGAYEVRADNSVVKYYSFGGTSIMRDTNGLHYMLTDHLGSVVAVTNSAGTLESEQRYLPFGQVRTDVGSIAQTDYGYTGQRALDSDMGGIMDYKARFYSPYINRFLQPDSIVPNAENPQAWNRYAYALNNPIRYNDPSGHEFKCPACAIWQSIWDWYTGKSDGYTGPNGMVSPLWHGPKQVILNASGMDNNANGLPKFLSLSMLHSKEVHLTGAALENIKQDPGMEVYNNHLMDYITTRHEYGNEPFSKIYEEEVEFGGDRDEVGLLGAALNQSTWELRHAKVEADVRVDKKGNVNILSYEINGDVNDFSPSRDRIWQHNVLSVIFGIPYHGILGGSNKMKVYAKWKPE